MALLPPPSNWKKIALGKDEKLWVYLMVFMLLMMGVMTVGYVFVGDQNPPETYRKVPTSEYYQQALAGNDASGAKKVNIKSQPALQLLSGVDANGDGGELYLVARQWNWTLPATGYIANGIQIKKGESYRLHIGSVDVLHGFQLIGSNFIIALQIVPGYDYILDFVPNETGTFRIICNEFCGPLHHQMTGFLQVVD